MDNFIDLKRINFNLTTVLFGIYIIVVRNYILYNFS